MKSSDNSGCFDVPGAIEDSRWKTKWPMCFSRRLVRGYWAALLMIFGLFPTNDAFAWERGAVLDAIHQVENPTNSTRVGRRGELGPYQLRPVVWRSYTDKPFSLAADHAEAYVVAEKHLEWISRGLARNGLDVSPYHIALAWNAGLMATVNGRTSKGSRHYAQRVANLVEHTVVPAREVAVQ